ncbi:hypothetical protein ABZ403_14950 [Micromonospora zamorensis]|uniref:hypothetical protein n=1 Tax=Micromonospora zamorensis TaxID=709883 RepID=UPI0033F3D4D9
MRARTPASDQLTVTENDQSVKIRYVPNPPWVGGWYGGSDLASARGVALRDGANKKITIVLSDPS